MRKITGIALVIFLVVLAALGLIRSSGAPGATEEPSAQVVAPSPQGVDQWRDAGDSGSNIHEVTLITGDVVVVTILPDGEKQLQVKSADATSPQALRLLEDGTATLLAPLGAGLAKLDAAFFNVDYLIEAGYHESDSLPVIIAATEGARLDLIEIEIEGHGAMVCRVSAQLDTIEA